VKTKQLRLYGAGDARLEEYELPPLGKDEILARVVSDSLCMSSYKAYVQGAEHKRVPNNLAQNPIVLGHEFCGEIIEVSEKWKGKYQAGDRFVIQPALHDPVTFQTVGYSFTYIGGCATYVIVPDILIESGCLLPYHGNAYFYGSLAEPMSCIAGAFHASYHVKMGTYEHIMGIKRGGSLALLAAAGPMGMGALDYALHADIQPSRIVVTDMDKRRLARMQALYPPEEAAKHGVELLFRDMSQYDAPIDELLTCNENCGYDDVMVFAANRVVVEQGDKILGLDGCLNFFAGPTDTAFEASANYYNIHYTGAHMLGTSGGNVQDMVECIALMEAGRINPAGMITHVGGLNASLEATAHFPQISGGKKLIYTGIDMPLTAIEDFAELGKNDVFYRGLNEIVKNNHNVWCKQAEDYLLGKQGKRGK